MTEELCGPYTSGNSSISSIEPVRACSHCADAGGERHSERTRILNMLALIEHPTALPVEAAMRIAAEVLLWCDADDLARTACDNPANSVRAA
jgi:hypothetical protein